MTERERERELEAEAKRRVQQSTPWLSDEAWTQWLASVAARGGKLALTLDGCLASYPTESAPTRHVDAAKGQSE